MHSIQNGDNEQQTEWAALYRNEFILSHQWITHCVSALFGTSVVLLGCHRKLYHLPKLPYLANRVWNRVWKIVYFGSEIGEGSSGSGSTLPPKNITYSPTRGQWSNGKPISPWISTRMVYWYTRSFFWAVLPAKSAFMPVLPLLWGYVRECYSFPFFLESWAWILEDHSLPDVFLVP